MGFARIPACSITSSCHLEDFPLIIFEIRAGQGTLMDGAEPWAAPGMGREVWQLEVLGRWCWKQSCLQDWFWTWGRKGSPQRATTSFIVGRERREDRLYRALKALCNPGCQEVINTCLGFLNSLTGFFLSWSRAGWAPGDINPGSMVLFLLRASQGEGEQGWGVGADSDREGEPAQPLLWAFPAPSVIPTRSILRVTLSSEWVFLYII